LERSRVCRGSTFCVHREPNRPNDKTDDPGRDVLRNFHSFFVGELLRFLIVGLDFGSDHRAIRVGVLWLNARNGRGIATCTRSQGEAKGHRRKHLGTQNIPPDAALQ
jgi:hypothetical protein